MTPAQLIEEIKHLSPEDKRVLMDEVLQILRNETEPSRPRKSVAERLYGIAKPGFETRDELESSQRQNLSLSQRLYGILKFDGDPPNDDEVKDLLTDYLIRKYS